MTTIPVPRQLLEQAMLALLSCAQHFGFARLHESTLQDTIVRGNAHKCAAALRDLLAQPEHEPTPVKAETQCPHGADLYDYCKLCDMEVSAQLDEQPEQSCNTCINRTPDEFSVKCFDCSVYYGSMWEAKK